MAAIDVVKNRIARCGLGTAVADAIAAAITSAGFELASQPGGEQGNVIEASPPSRRRVPASGGALGSVQICTSAIGGTESGGGWWVWREHWTAEGALVVSDGIFVPGATGIGIESVAGFTAAGEDIQAAAVTGGLSASVADAGVAMIAAAGYAVQPTGGGSVTSPLPAATVERRIVPGTGGRLQLVAVTLGTAGWAVWSERSEPLGVAFGGIGFIPRPSGYSGGPWGIS